jgi:3-oxo-5alpha-steroid 4-dehydrogenase
MRNRTTPQITRRDFVKGAAASVAAAAAAGTVMAGCSPAAPAGLPKKWDQEADVIVVGFGGAGAAAAIEARKAGAKVLVLERKPGGGGSTALCGGIIYMGGGTPLQKTTGFSDTPDAMFKYLLAAAGDGADEAKIRVLCDKSVDLYDWLLGVGVKFKQTYIDGRAAQPMTDDGLVWSGNERQAKFAAITPAVPRGHKVQAPAASGAALWPPLQKAATDAGAQVLTETLAKRLIVNASGRVVGVVADSGGKEINLKAKKGVILTAGGFFANKDMVKQHCPKFVNSGITGTDGDDGSGIRMGQGAGGDIKQMGLVDASSFTYLCSEALIKGILVNMNGRRFVGEDNYGSWVGDKIVREYPMSFLIVDAAVQKEVEATTPEAFKSFCKPVAQADTVTALATALKIPASLLESTFAAYNQFAANGEDPEMQKEKKYVVPLKTGPFFAYAFVAQGASCFTMGGLCTNTESQVLDVWGKTIVGLYAAGRNAALVEGSMYPGSGTSVAGALIFGRIAGKSAAALEAWK